MTYTGLILLAAALFPYAIVYNRIFRNSKHIDDRVVVMCWFNIFQSVSVAALLIYHITRG